MPMKPSVTAMNTTERLPIQYSWRAISPCGRPWRWWRDARRTMPATVPTKTCQSSRAATPVATTAPPTASI